MKTNTILYITALALFIFPSNAYAYMDPGTGSMLLQVLAASLLGLGVFWRRITTFLKGVFRKKSDN